MRLMGTDEVTMAGYLRPSSLYRPSLYRLENYAYQGMRLMATDKVTMAGYLRPSSLYRLENYAKQRLDHNQMILDHNQMIGQSPSGSVETDEKGTYPSFVDDEQVHVLHVVHVVHVLQNPEFVGVPVLRVVLPDVDAEIRRCVAYAWQRIFGCARVDSGVSNRDDHHQLLTLPRRRLDRNVSTVGWTIRHPLQPHLGLVDQPTLDLDGNVSLMMCPTSVAATLGTTLVRRKPVRTCVGCGCVSQSCTWYVCIWRFVWLWFGFDFCCNEGDVVDESVIVRVVWSKYKISALESPRPH